MRIFNFPDFYIPSYSLGERILRTRVFQIGVAQGLLERILMWAFRAFSQRTYSPQVFDHDRAERGLEDFTRLGAQVDFVVPKDGKARIQMMTLQASDMESKLEELGATWEKISILDNDTTKSILAVIPPSSPTEEWDDFEQDLFKLKWNKREVLLENGETQEVIVTCENSASIAEDDWYQNLFLHVNSSSVSFIMLARRAGFYLGCKQNICFYDPRGTWKSTGIASEAGYYNDAMAVFERMEKHFSPQNIWVTSACGGSGPAGYLKSITHESGVNFIFENGFSNLKTDFVDPQGAIVENLAKCYWSGLSSKDIAEEHKPKETGFDLYALWKDLELTDLGKVMIITVSNDQRLSPDVALRNAALAERVNSNIRHIYFTSTSQDPHFDRYFKYADARAEALAFIFNSKNCETTSV